MVQMVQAEEFMLFVSHISESRRRKGGDHAFYNYTENNIYTWTLIASVVVWKHFEVKN